MFEKARTPARSMYIDGTYGQSNPTWHVEDSPWKAEQIMRVFEPPADRSLRICEIGCGVGGVLGALDTILKTRGVSATLVGFDIAPEAIAHARKLWRDRPRITFECQDVLDLERLDFDLCLLIDVLEHLEDPHAFLTALRRRGVSDCILHLPLEKTWVNIVRGKTDPRRSRVGHLHFYDTRGALSLMKSARLAVGKWVYTPEMELDIKLHRTPGTILAYLPRKAMFGVVPSLAVRRLGGAAMMARARFE